MIKCKDHKTPLLFDPFHFMGPKRKQMLQDSWAALFKEVVLNELPVDELAKYFNLEIGRPTKELHTILGVIQLQQMFNLTDLQTINELAFNSLWHYALDITNESDEEKYLCEKTLWNVRNIIVSHDIANLMFDNTTEKLAKVFEVNTNNQRMDSVHMCSNMKRLSRINVLARVIEIFLRNLKRQHQALYESLPEKIRERYCSQKAMQCFSMVKPNEAKKTLQQTAEDLYDLAEFFSETPDVISMSTYKNLLRVLHEQCRVTQDEGEPLLVGPKPNKEVPSDSLQNPSDEDATYDGHKGQGYQTQVMETFTTTLDPKAKAQELDLVTFVEVETACEHDSGALVPALQSVAERGLEPEVVLADSAYGSDANVVTAAKQGVEVVSPTMGRGTDGEVPLISEFEFGEDFAVVRCAGGQVPEEIKQTKSGYSAVFVACVCVFCPYLDRCPASGSGRRRYVHYQEKDVRLSIRRAYEATAEFKDRYRMRSGVEATMSQLDRLTGIKHLRVRGRPAVRLAATLKVSGLNILRATCARKARKIAGTWPLSPILGGVWSIFSFKERFVAVLDWPKIIFLQISNFCSGRGKKHPLEIESVA